MSMLDDSWRPNRADVQGLLERMERRGVRPGLWSDGMLAAAPARDPGDDDGSSDDDEDTQMTTVGDATMASLTNKEKSNVSRRNKYAHLIGE
jgi:hypothetical protein